MLIFILTKCIKYLFLWQTLNELPATNISRIHQIVKDCIERIWQFSFSVLCTVSAPVFGNQWFGTWEHYGKAHGSLLSRTTKYSNTLCCWFPTSSNILILPSHFWQIRFESCWLHCSQCRILALLRYCLFSWSILFHTWYFKVQEVL